MGFEGKKAKFIAGRGGFNGSNNQSAIPITDLLQADNISFDGNSWRRIPGISAFDSNAVISTPALVGALDYHPSSAVNRIISAWSDGSVYRENSGNVDAGTLDTGLTFTEPAVFIEAGNELNTTNKKLFMFTLGTAPQYIDGDAAAFSAVSASADWSGGSQPAGAVVHDHRLWAWLDHRLYASALDAHHDFSGDAILPQAVFPGEGERIMGCVSFLPQTLHVLKYPFGLYKVDTSDILGYVLPKIKIRDDIGLGGPLAIGRVKNDYWFVSAIGHIHSLRATDNQEAIEDTDITAALNLENWVKQNVDLSRIQHTKLIYDSIRQEVSVTYTAKNDSRGSIRLVIDVREGSPKIAVDSRANSANVIFEHLFKYTESDKSVSIYSGGEGGLIWKLNQDARNVNGAAYLSELRTIDSDLSIFDPSNEGKLKRLYWLELIVTATGNHVINIDIIVDGRVVVTRQFALGLTGGTLGAFVLGTSQLGGREFLRLKQPINGTGDRVGLRAYNSSLNHDFSISEMVLHYDTLGESGSK